MLNVEGFHLKEFTLSYALDLNNCYIIFTFQLNWTRNGYCGTWGRVWDTGSGTPTLFCLVWWWDAGSGTLALF